MSHQSAQTRLNEKNVSCPSPSQSPVQSSSGICIKQEYFEDQLHVTVKTEAESPPNEHNIMQSIKVEVKEEHYDDQDCVVKCELDFDEGEQINRKIKVKLEDVSSGQSFQHFKFVKKEEDGGEYVMECDCEDCEICRVKMEMKEELDESGSEMKFGGNNVETVQGCTRAKKEDDDGDGEVERPYKIRRMDGVVGNIVNSPLNPVHTDQDETEVDDNKNGGDQDDGDEGDQTIEQRQDTTGDGQQVPAKNFLKRIEPADELGNKFECNYQQCGKRTKDRSNLINHIRTHTGEKRFKCTVNGCDRTFVQKSQLRSHLNTHSGTRLFVCSWPRCEARFATNNNLTVHLRTHTGERPFQCDQCDATFTQHAHLVTHLRTHTGARPFVCTWPECSQAFTTSGCSKVYKLYKRKDAFLRHQNDKHN